MHMDRTYTKYILQDGGARYRETREDGFQRTVDENHQGLLAWLAAGNETQTVVCEPPSLDVLRAELKTRINNERAVRFGGVFTHGQGRYDLDDGSRNKMTGVAAMVANGRVTDPVLWRDHDNVIHELAPQAFLDLCGAVNVYSQALYVVSWTKKQEVDGLGSPEAATAYAVDAGWPEV